MGFYLALDVGGTKADYVLADDTRELGRVRSGTIKRMRVDAATATANLEGALAGLTAQTGVGMRQVRRTCVGTAGNTVPLVRNWLREALSARVAGELILVGDVEIGLDAAFFGGPGVVVLAGTGSNVAGRARDGRLQGAGGWGPALADQGSGHRIGLEGLRAGFLALDEERETGLLAAVIKFWDLASLDELIALGNEVPAPDFSRLTSLVVELASIGDEVAAGVLKKEGEDLGYLVRLMMRRLGGVHPVAFTGSIVENVPAVRKALMDAVREEFPGVREIEGVVDPIAGAVWRARMGQAPAPAP